AANSLSLSLQEPSNKRVRPLGRVTSLANLISPARNGAVRRFGQTIQSISFRGEGKSPSGSQKSCSKTAAPTPPKRRNSTLWSETLDVSMKGNFSAKEIKRQEAIFELSRGEKDLIEDLKLARKFPGLNAYKAYCSKQLAAKTLLDQKKQDRRVQDFLQRCLESPFSRKLDLWSFLDIPRSRLVKYPLLLKEILKHTPNDHPDVQSLEGAISIIHEVLSGIDLKKGESDCQYFIDKLEYLDDRQKDPRIETSKTLLCHGELRNKSGTKLYVFLFQDILIFTRPVTRNERQCYQVYRQPIPVQDLVLEDLQDGDVRMGGSFRGAFSNSDKAKHIFRVRFQDTTQGQSHTLQGSDIFHKQQWLNCIRTAIAAHQPAQSPTRERELPQLNEEPKCCSPQARNIKVKRWSSTLSGIVHMEADENTSETGSIEDTTEEIENVQTSVRKKTSIQKTKKEKSQSIGKRKEKLV
ncbi:UNVERIFIED_CONTAM: hypothetical protein FKN15_008688, partial [Acipenser sinensis]